MHDSTGLRNGFVLTVHAELDQASSEKPAAMAQPVPATAPYLTRSKKKDARVSEVSPAPAALAALRTSATKPLRRRISSTVRYRPDARRIAWSASARS